MKDADPLPWSRDLRGRLVSASGNVIFDPVSFDPLQGVKGTNDVNAEIMEHMSHIAHEDFLVVVPEMQDVNYVSSVQREVHNHANRVFPHRQPAKAWLKLFEELGEVIKDPTNAQEWADVFYLLFDLSEQNGINIVAALRDKMPILERRVWTETPTGTYQHVAEAREIKAAVSLDCQVNVDLIAHPEGKSWLADVKPIKTLIPEEQA